MAVRIAGVTLPNEKRVEAGLQAIYGIGFAKAREILKSTKVNSNTRIKDLTNDEANRLREFIEKNYKVEGNLKKDVLLNIKRLKEIKAYRGTRHQKNLPVRGQRTKTNSRTVRGNVRKTAASGKKLSAQKT
ncbi:30S ribosomal protein S13 [Patescibacteria group bacterium]|nr:30S ribosomal protein S13 [Patescibacteria group bacterium]